MPKRFNREEAAAHFGDHLGVVLLNGGFVLLIAVAMFGVLMAVLKRNGFCTMKTTHHNNHRSRRGFLEVDLLVGLAILSAGHRAAGASHFCARERQGAQDGILSQCGQ